jgi:hypothetical protein
MRRTAPSIVHQIVDRRHVGESNREVIRYFISRLRDGMATWRTMSRAERKKWLRWVIKAHGENRALYQKVMKGNF